MSSIDGKIKNLLNGRGACLHYSRVELGDEKEPDIMIDNIYAKVVEEENKKDIVVYLSKEDDENRWNAYEIYRIPFTNNKYFLRTFLKEVKKRSMEKILEYLF